MFVACPRPRGSASGVGAETGAGNPQRSTQEPQERACVEIALQAMA
jgi:hypothetical protein